MLFDKDEDFVLYVKSQLTLQSHTVRILCDHCDAAGARECGEGVKAMARARDNARKVGILKVNGSDYCKACREKAGL